MEANTSTKLFQCKEGVEVSRLKSGTPNTLNVNLVPDVNCPLSYHHQMVIAHIDRPATDCVNGLARLVCRPKSAGEVAWEGQSCLRKGGASVLGGGVFWLEILVQLHNRLG